MPKKVSVFKPAEFPAVLWKRAAAYIIDSVIIGLIIALPFQDLLKEYEDKPFSFFFSNANVSMNLFLVTLVSVLILMAYWTIFEFKFQQSIGKMLFNIKVHSLKGSLTVRQAFLRNISKISTILLLLDVIYMFAKKGRQRYLEVISGTEVIEALPLQLGRI